MIFVTGATGLLGRFLVKALINNGYTIKALKRVQSDISCLKEFADKIEWVEGDLSDVNLLTEAVKDCNTIIHAAALISYQKQDKENLLKTNVTGTANLVNAALIAKVPYFCMISSVAALGKPKGVTKIDENSNFEDSTLVTNYGKSKYLAELEVYRGIEEGLNAFFINPSVILGPSDWSKGSSQIFKYVYEKGLFYSSGKLNYIDVRDVADIVCKLLDQKDKISGEKYVLNTGQIDYETFFAKIAEKLGVRKPPVEAGPFLTSIAWRLYAVKSIISGKPALVSRETAMLAKNQCEYENGKLKNLLNFQFRPWQETVDWICAELISSNKLGKEKK